MERIVTIGGSAGSLSAVVQILTHLKASFKYPIVIVFHRRFTVELIIENLLQTKTKLKVKEAEDKDFLTSNCIYLAPPDYHLLVEKDYSLSLDLSEKVNFSRPSIDVTFLSAIDVFKEKTIGIILSGANADGVESMRKINEIGGICIVQSPDSAEINFMPNQVINSIEPNYIANPVEIASYLNRLS